MRSMLSFVRAGRRSVAPRCAEALAGNDQVYCSYVVRHPATRKFIAAMKEHEIALILSCPWSVPVHFERNSGTRHRRPACGVERTLVLS
jgi:hypothetical protein